MIKSAKYVTSFEKFDKSKNLEPLSQIAFVGRSNVGKSSLINMIVNQRNLAITSKTPGRTRLINFFEIKLNDANIHFVDLPGYGFAKASKSTQHGWGQHITDFLVKSEHLEHVFVLLDIRHKPSKLDEAMVGFLQMQNIPASIIATKCDKLSRPQLQIAIQSLVKELGITKESIIITSSQDKKGREEIISKLILVSNVD